LCNVGRLNNEGVDIDQQIHKRRKANSAKLGIECIVFLHEEAEEGKHVQLQTRPTSVPGLFGLGLRIVPDVMAASAEARKSERRK
jgi:hypothetical protein